MPERKLSYQTLEHKSDTGFLIEAPSLQRLFIDAASALTDLLVKLELIADSDKKTIQVEALNKEQLLIKWLNEVLFLFEKDKFISKRIVFNYFNDKKISATLFGETYQPVKHGHASEIKAATFHQLELGMKSEPDHVFFAKIFLDL